MSEKKDIKKLFESGLLVLLGGISGGGLALFGWLWTFMMGYQIFFAQGDWGGAALFFEQPTLYLWSMIGSALFGFLIGVIAVSKRSATILGFAILPMLPALLLLALGVLALVGVVHLFMLALKLTHRKKEKSQFFH